MPRVLAILLFAVAPGAAAQVSLPAPGLPGLPVLEPRTDKTLAVASPVLSVELRRLRVRELLRQERDTLERGPGGEPIVRGQVGVLSPSEQALARARQAGFTVLHDDPLEGVGLRLVLLAAPEGMSTRRALKRLRGLDPDGIYDFNFVYTGGASEIQARAVAHPAPGPASTDEADPGPVARARIGLVDSGVDPEHPALAGVEIHRYGCNGNVVPAAHGTAVASLLAGDAPDFRGARPGASLYAADVFCGGAGGNFGALALALDWLARERVPVVNISLVGAKSVLLTGLVRAMTERGYLLVASVGNDGPAAPPLYPAAYPAVIGVTAVDRRDRVLPEAGRGPHVEFAAPGADMLAAQPGGGYGEVRGTSFATPLVAGLLAEGLDRPDRARADAARARLEIQAEDLGPAGRDESYGRGLVGRTLRLPAGPPREN